MTFTLITEQYVFRGRTTLTGGTLNITSVKLEDEGYYWGELVSGTAETLLSDRHPLHVYFMPRDPTLTPKGRDVVLEDTTVTVAECRSKVGAEIVVGVGSLSATHCVNVIPVNSIVDLAEERTRSDCS